MSNDEIREDIHNITQLYRRTIIENDKLMRENKYLDKKIQKKEKKNKDLSVESLALITRLVSARKQIDFTKGYHNALKNKSRMDLFENLNIDIDKNTYLQQCNEPPYKNAPYNKGYRHGLYEFDYCMNNFTIFESKKRRYSIPKWRKKFDAKRRAEKKAFEKMTSEKMAVKESSSEDDDQKT